MKQMIKKTAGSQWLCRRFRYLNGYLLMVIDFLRFRRLAARSSKRFEVMWRDRFPCLLDKTDGTSFDAHYIYHPAWAARIVAQTSPQEHVDISSSLHFCTMISAFIPTRFYDFRPADLTLSGLKSSSMDLRALPLADDSILSLSCMHVVEHVGLGRYGDEIDPDGDLKAISELTRVLAPGGSLLFVVPIGQPKIMFNAHRIYSFQQIVDYFPTLRLNEFALVPDSAEGIGLVRDANKELADKQKYGCGCFWFIK